MADAKKMSKKTGKPMKNKAKSKKKGK